jgi:hypothetical protein
VAPSAKLRRCSDPFSPLYRIDVLEVFQKPLRS